MDYDIVSLIFEPLLGYSTTLPMNDFVPFLTSSKYSSLILIEASLAPTRVF